MIKAQPNIFKIYPEVVAGAILAIRDAEKKYDVIPAYVECLKYSYTGGWVDWELLRKAVSDRWSYLTYLHINLEARRICGKLRERQ